jgi:hypothetical protein
MVEAFIEDDWIQLASRGSIWVDRALLSIVEDASPAAAVPEHLEAVGFNCKGTFFEAQTDYSVHIGLQQKHLCSVAATHAVMALADILRRQGCLQLAVTRRSGYELTERFDLGW